jgi:hypothetical protein
MRRKIYDGSNQQLKLYYSIFYNLSKLCQCGSPAAAAAASSSPYVHVCIIMQDLLQISSTVFAMYGRTSTSLAIPPPPSVLHLFCIRTFLGISK